MFYKGRLGPGALGGSTHKRTGDQTIGMSDDDKRRPRRSYNCGPCKRQKIKCDTQIPCGACKRHNRVDQCLAQPPNPPSPDHRKRVRKQSLSAFGEDAREIRDILQPLPQPQQQQQPVFPVKLPSIHTYTTTFKVSDKFPHSYTQDSSISSVSVSSVPTQPPPPSSSSSSGLPQWDRFLPESSTELSQLKRQVSVLTERLAQLEHRVSSSPSAEPTPCVAPRQKEQAFKGYNDSVRVLPERPVLAHIVSFFKQHLNRPLEILDDKVVDGRFASFRLKEEPERPTPEDWENLSLLAIIVSLAVLHYRKDRIEEDLRVKPENVVPTANSLLQVSKNALRMVRYKESPRLIHLQILLLYDISLRLFNKKNLSMAMGSELVSMAYVLGLQTHKIPQNSLEIDVSQKIWWIICHNDTLNSLKFGIPTLIRLEGLPKDQVGNSQILKAFISAELSTSYQTILTHIAKLTKICNEVPPSMGSSLVEYLENLIMVDRQLTSYQVPQSLSILNPRNDINMNFQCCYLHFFITLNRLRIYRKIYFSSPDDGIWFVMLSIVESFLERYNKLREMYPPEEYLNHYLQLSNCIVYGTIMNVIMLATEPDKLPRGLKDILAQYSISILKDMSLFRATIFNESVPFYQRAFETIDSLTSYLHSQNREENLQKQQSLSLTLQKSRVFDSHESPTGLMPSNDFFNVYFGNIAHHQRNVTLAAHTWKLDGVLGHEQLEFLSCLGV